jgi:flagellar FliL protein
MKSKLKILIPVLLVAVGGIYKFALAKPAPAAEPKIHGEVYVLPKDFLVNLQGGRFAKLGVGLIFERGFTAATAAGGHGAGSAPPTGYGVLPQEAVVRSIVTDVLTDQAAERLQGADGREQLQTRILRRITKQTDVKADEVLFTDVAIQ